ncbi:hypothetical protein IQ273_08575 [Nodosilinea sp. LEGE 07298]|uniref:hypothetical protein n=1 Tax=Nodosilinea sp. LEGE 07298 TaxID=2777970 RepID=UPI00188154A2|nr:hypothetical protein [Nodosilinea sp. LEGE 07298]MBE9109469.1 hypothetical protein [Nodosilinea sp. LEGE 07298]
MQVRVSSKDFFIDGDRAGHEANDSQRYKALLIHWAQAIESLSQDGEAAAIPIDSEYVEFGQFVLVLAAIKQGDRVVVRSLWVLDDWFDWDTAYIMTSLDNDALRFSLARKSFATTGIFGEYNLHELVSGLLNAKEI